MRRRWGYEEFPTTKQMTLGTFLDCVSFLSLCHWPQRALGEGGSAILGGNTRGRKTTKRGGKRKNCVHGNVKILRTINRLVREGGRGGMKDDYNVGGEDLKQSITFPTIGDQFRKKVRETLFQIFPEHPILPTVLVLLPSSINKCVASGQPPKSIKS